MSLVRCRDALYCSVLLSFLLTAAPGRAQDSAQGMASDFEGRTITSIEFPRDQPLYNEELHQLLEAVGIREHQPLHESSVRDAIKRLFRTERFTDIKVNAEPSDGGVILQFLTTNAWFIGNVTVSGKISEPPNSGQLVNAARLDLGTPFDPAMLEPAEQGISKLLVANGFYESILTHRLNYSSVAQQVNITFEIISGRRASYTEPTIDGHDLILTPKQIAKSSGWHKFLIPGWRQVTQKRTSQGIRNIRLRYEKAGRLLATVQLSDLEYIADKKPKVKPTVTVDPGEKLKIKTVGYKISGGKLQSNVPVYEEHAVDNDLLLEGANNLRDELQAAGYFEAEVEYKEQKKVGDTEEIDYVITPGVRHSLVSLKITGNQYFTTRTIRERMFLEAASFQYRHGRFSNAFLRRDKESIANLYRANGFRDVSVTSETIDDYQGKPGALAAEIRIHEGKQWLVSQLNVKGYKQLDLTRILVTLNSSADQPFSEFNIAADREQILNYYFENGFPNAQFNWTSTPGPKAAVVDVEYDIKEGNQQFVRQVLYTGLRTTKPPLVDKQLQLNPGDPLSPVAMSDTQRRLYDLGIFAEVDMAIQNADGDSDHKYVLYDMEEASRYNFTGGIGAQIARIGGSTAANDLSNPSGATGFSPLFEFDVTRLNFLGKGQTLALRSDYSSYDKKVQLTYLYPRIFGNSRKYDLTVSAIYDDSFDVRTFAARREEISAQLTDRLSKALTAFFRLDYRNTVISNLKIDPLLVPLLAQTTRTGLVAVNLVDDTRDDPTDPHRGMYNSLDLGVASHYLGGRNNFIRVLGRNSTFYHVRRNWILARQTSFGILPTYGRAPVTSPEDTDPIPLAERFYSGGADTLRAFPQNQAGPRDIQTGFPLGGSVLFFNNTELRFPLLGDNIGGVLFEDFGNVFDRPGDISFSFHQPHPDNPTDFNYIVHDAGFGIRYKTPIGPVRLDLAYAINPPKYNGYAGSFTDLVNCTATNTCTRELLQISHFQFFFSIGQTF
jgi:outer membrane protein insertion porin family